LLSALLMIGFLTGGIAGLIVSIILAGQIALSVFAWHMSLFADDAEALQCWQVGFSIGAAAVALLVAVWREPLSTALAIGGMEALLQMISGTFQSVRKCV